MIQKQNGTEFLVFHLMGSGQTWPAQQHRHVNKSKYVLHGIKLSSCLIRVTLTEVTGNLSCPVELALNAECVLCC